MSKGEAEDLVGQGGTNSLGDRGKDLRVCDGAGVTQDQGEATVKGRRSPTESVGQSNKVQLEEQSAEVIGESTTDQGGAGGMRRSE